MVKHAYSLATQRRRQRLSLFEKVILANSVMLIGEALAALWATSHNIEAHHYFIDTGFVVLATLLGILINIMLLRASFQPLFTLLATMRAVSAGHTNERALPTPADTEIGKLAQAFNSMLDRLEEARREQTIGILQAQEEEQRRIALELHDETGQNLTALLIHTEFLSQRLAALPAAEISNPAQQQLHEGLEYLTSLTQQTLESLRALVQQLRPSVLDDLGLASAFRWLAEDGRQRLHLHVDVHIDDGERSPQLGHLPVAYETALFRIAQESLTNAARHAHAQCVSISLTQEQSEVHLQIRDDGRGFDTQQRSSGSGMFGMRERATVLGGSIHIQSSLERGTTVQVALPLPSSAIEQEAVHA